jgi:hypothetical protein
MSIASSSLFFFVFFFSSTTCGGAAAAAAAAAAALAALAFLAVSTNARRGGGYLNCINGEQRSKEGKESDVHSQRPSTWFSQSPPSATCSLWVVSRSWAFARFLVLAIPVVSRDRSYSIVRRRGGEERGEERDREGEGEKRKKKAYTTG